MSTSPSLQHKASAPPGPSLWQRLYWWLATFFRWLRGLLPWGPIFRWTGRVLLAVYLVALAASYVQRWQMRNDPPPPITSGKRTVQVPAIRGEQVVPGEVTIAYRDVPAAHDDPGKLPVLLIHGSPGDADAFDLYMLRMNHDPAADSRKRPTGPGEESDTPFTCIPGERRIIAPDLPGFADSTKDLPDYSFLAHAHYVLEMMDKLGIQRAHIVGFSMGGGVVLQLARLAPDRIASVTLQSAITVQEMEMLGDYHINHGIHGAQLGMLWAARTLVPRFGSWNRLDMGIPYARNFYDSDQRPLRAILQNYQGPMLVLQGQDDPLVPVEAAYEASRLVPQSELHVFVSSKNSPYGEFEANHFMTFMEPRPLLAALQPFLDHVEAGTAVTRATAPADRVARAALPMDTTHWPKPGFITSAVTLLFLALATFLSEDLACITAGVLVAEGRLALLPAILACFAGIFLGDLALYVAGRWFGRAALRLPPLRWMIGERHLERAGNWIARNGAAMVFISRFTPGARLPTYFTAGVLRTPLRKFLWYFLLAALVWTPLLVGVSAGIGLPFVHSDFLARQPLSIKLLVGGAAIYVIARLLEKLLTYRGRRALVGWWKRKRRWEFWSAYVFYPPVVLYILWLGLRHRSFTLFTAANPAIPAGGFIGEEKHQILKALVEAKPWMPLYTLIPAGRIEARVRQAEEFLAANHLAFPVVLKPDAGQRGSGVAIIRSHQQLNAYLSHPDFPAILQEYLPGIEFGVFYYRYPNEARGHIFSITEKKMPVLIGDGVHTLERLILQDDRAVCMGDFYLRQNEERMESIPASGERVQLVELGTHCRGAIFLDGSDLISEPLLDSIDSIAQRFEGFYFGRFDVRVPSREDLKAGRNFRVVELNGVTSEATHIYDPKLTLWQAYATLFRQWRIAFEIGAQNRARGVRPTGPVELLRLIPHYRKLSKGYPE